MVEVLKKELALPFDDAVKAVEKAATEAGFMVMMVKPIHEVFKQKLGVDYPRYTMLCVCGADIAKMALDAAKEAGALFPCSFVVYEDGGKVYAMHVSTMKSAVELRLAPAGAMQPAIEEAGKRTRKVWERI
ncbi:MAG: DUF302 domain-containing protein [Candidatus Lokiarchaeota archaeon]|nr:DUF302 domain-containing protein [Candidatus Lokiarchaeota archaeon]